MGDPAVTGDIVEGFRNLHRILAVKLLSWAHITWACCSLADSGLKSVISGLFQSFWKGHLQILFTEVSSGALMH